MSRLCEPLAASRTMRALKTSRTAEVVQRTVFSNTSRSAAVSSILGARRIDPPFDDGWGRIQYLELFMCHYTSTPCLIARLVSIG